MTPSVLQFTTSLAFLSSINFTTANHHNNNEHTHPTHHAIDDELHRHALASAFRSSPTFSSVQEQRSYYYFHSGMEMAAKNAMTMAGFERGDIDEDAYLAFLEEALEEELRRVQNSLREMKMTAGEEERENIQQEWEQQEDKVAENMDNDAGDRGTAAEKHSKPENKPENDTDGDGDGIEDDDDAEDSSDDGDDEDDDEHENERPINAKYAEEYLHFQCQNHVGTLLPNPEDKLNELRSLFWEFAGVPPSQDIKKYTPSQNMYIDYIASGESNDNTTVLDTDTTSSETQTTTSPSKRGIFASKDFQEGDIVYSSEINALYFQELSTWSDFLHTLPTSQDACMVLHWSFMQKISRPGRWLVMLVLDEGVFMRNTNFAEGEEKNDDINNTEEERGRLSMNVALGRYRSLLYFASRDIKKGEEIIAGAGASYNEDLVF